MYLKKIEKSIKFEHFNNERCRFLLLFLPLDPDPDPETRLNPDPIRIRNTAQKRSFGKQQINVRHIVVEPAFFDWNSLAEVKI